MYFTDQLKRTIQLNSPPERIVSLVPSQTELLYTLRLHNRVAGITRFCIHPADWRQKKTVVGGTKNIDRNKIDRLKPDLIIANKEENTKEQLEELMQSYNVWISDVNTLDQATDMIRSVGEITGRLTAATNLVKTISAKFQTLANHQTQIADIKVAYIIWHKRIMAAGSGTFIHDMLKHCGLTNCFAAKNRYPVLGWDDLINCSADYVLLSSEPYPFSGKHLIQYRQMLKGKQVIKVNGEMFSWYGSRLLKAAGYYIKVKETLHRSINRN